MSRSRSYLEVRGGAHRGDLMTWPNPSDPEEVGWRLAHQSSPRPEDVRVAVSFMNAYAALIDLPQRDRHARIAQIRQAMQQAAAQSWEADR